MADGPRENAEKQIDTSMVQWNKIDGSEGWGGGGEERKWSKLTRIVVEMR